MLFSEHQPFLSDLITMLRHCFLASCLFVTSMAAQAGLISHGAYSRASDATVVSSADLEWLMWDATKGLSIDDALAKYQSQGWVLASNAQMADLFKAFQFGKDDWLDTETLSQEYAFTWSADELSIHNTFISMFGMTNSGVVCPEVGPAANCHRAADPLWSTRVFFGADGNQDGRYNLASVSDDRTLLNNFGSVLNIYHYAILADDGYGRDESLKTVGVALVRAPSSVVAVSAPSSISLLALVFLALLGYRRQTARR